MSSTLAALQQRKDRLDEELKQVEKQVYDLETTYLNDSSQYGNVLKGFESVLSQTKNTSQKKARNFKAEDRMFSLSSTSSPVVDEIAAEKQEEKTVTTQSGRKAGGGVHVISADGKTVCNNSLDDRLTVAFERNVPEIRTAIFGANPNIKTKA